MTIDMQRTVPVLRRLLEQTRAGKLAWVPTDKPDAFLYTASGVAVLSFMRKTTRPGGDWNTPAVRIFNAEGTAVADLDGDGDDVDWDLLSELHAVARTKALGISETLDALEQSLGPEEAPF